MKIKFFVMAMMIVGAMCSCTAQSGANVEPGCDVFKTEQGTTVKMYCIKHGSVRMQVGEKWIYVDPVTTAVKPVTDYSTLPQADYILVTHEHFDHLDSVAINQLSKPGTVLITNARCHEILGMATAAHWLKAGPWMLFPPTTTRPRSSSSTPRAVTTASC